VVGFADTTLKDDNGIETQCMLGAQNVVFASDATRNARFVSPAALRATVDPVTKLAVTSDDPPQTPATGWWFRDNLSDKNLYPRAGNVYHSPGD
jgi:hypothetical protein